MKDGGLKLVIYPQFQRRKILPDVSVSDIHIYLKITVCSMVRPEKLIVAQLVNNFDHFIGIGNFVTAVTRLPNSILNGMEPVHILTFSSFKKNFNIFLPSTLRSPKWLLLSIYFHKIQSTTFINGISTEWFIFSGRFKQKFHDKQPQTSICNTLKSIAENKGSDSQS